MRVITLLFLSFLPSLLSAQQTGWLEKAGDMSSDNQAFGIAIDNAHNTITSGTFRDTTNFSRTILNSRGNADGFLAKYDSSGSLLWAKNPGGSDLDVVGRVAVDASNNIYISGFFKSSAFYFTPTDSVVKVAGAVTNSFIAKFDANGTYLWSRLIGSTAATEVRSIAVDPWGYPIVGGSFHTDVDIAGTPFSNPYYSLLVAKFTPAGSLVWAKPGYSLGLCKMNDVAADKLGNIFVTGKLSSDVRFGLDTIKQLQGDDGYFGKFDSAGNKQFFKVFGGWLFVTTSSGNFDAGNAIRPDKLGNFYVGGSILINYSPSFLSQKGFIAKYDDTGGRVWIDTFGTGSETVTGIAVDAANNPWVSGHVYGNDTIGGTAIPYTAGRNTFIARLDKANGNALWLKNSNTTIGSSGGDIIMFMPSGNIALDPKNGMVMAAGQFKSDISFDALSVTSTTLSTKNDIYLLRIWNYLPSIVEQSQDAPFDVRIYPNPASGQLNFELSSSPWHKVIMADETGRVVREWETNSASFAVDINAEAPGNYLVIITDNEGNRIAKKVSHL